MIVFCTSTHSDFNFKEICKAANVLHLEYGSGQSELITEPAHLLPKEQALWAEDIIERELSISISTYKQFIATTYENAILRTLRRVREKKISHEQVLVACLTKCSWDNNAKEIATLRVTEEGEFLDRWPDGFFDHRMEELF